VRKTSTLRENNKDSGSAFSPKFDVFARFDIIFVAELMVSAVCHSEHITSFRPVSAHFQTRRMARRQSSGMTSGLSALAVHRPLAVATADQFAHYTAQKHHHEPCQSSDATYYLKHADHKSVAEHKEQCKYLHTTSFSFFKDT